MSVKILLKRNTTNTNQPTAEQVEVGELAFNALTGYVFTKRQDGAIVQVGGPQPSGSAGTAGTSATSLGSSGTSATSASAGTSGTSATSATSATSLGSSGTAGQDGFGFSGTSGTSGYTFGTSGTSSGSVKPSAGNISVSPSSSFKSSLSNQGSKSCSWLNSSSILRSHSERSEVLLSARARPTF